MKIYQLKKSQILKCSLEEAWDFFSSPKNLQKITPEYMQFEITSSDIRDKMYVGQIITYKVRPVLGIPMNWATEISHVDQGKYFVDEQRFGPYSFWHHKHFFTETAEGVEMIDLVHYGLPLGIIGRLANTLFVRNKLEQIFNFRIDAVDRLFN